MSWHSRVIAATALAFTLAAFGVAVSSAAARVAQPDQTSCTPKFVDGALHLCGPATAKLSVFSGYTFRNGTCKRSVVAGDPAFVLELGALQTGQPHERPPVGYLKIEIYGPLSASESERPESSPGTTENAGAATASRQGQRQGRNMRSDPHCIG